MQTKGIAFDLEKPYDFGPEIMKIDAQFEEFPRTLKVIVEFTNQGVDFRVSVLFKYVDGFRVLDEGDLLKFWDNNPPEEWLWEIISGGWYDDERKNGNAEILSGRVDELTEYFVIGEGMCVSVICRGDETPIITMLG